MDTTRSDFWRAVVALFARGGCSVTSPADLQMADLSWLIGFGLVALGTRRRRR
ncbi:MAG: hypothetical protein QM813_08900 [Verrucomicrobiota bacterium]